MHTKGQDKVLFYNMRNEKGLGATRAKTRLVGPRKKWPPDVKGAKF